MGESRLVYSTDTGRICPKCSQPQTRCVCKMKRAKADCRKDTDGIIRIKREVKGRKGKTVTTISGFQGNDTKLKKIASELKNCCGTGGSVKDSVIMIQGDHRETVKTELKKRGFKVKLAGG